MKKQIFLLILFSSLLFAQGVRSGFRIDPAVLIADDAGESEILIAPFSLSIPFIIEPVPFLALETCTGFILGSEEFFGLEIGSLIRYDISESDFFVLAGMNHFFKTQTGSNHGGAQGGYFPFYGVGLGYNQTENIRIDLSYFVTSRKEYYGYYSFDHSTHYDKRILGMIRIGLNISFNIIRF